MATLKMGSTTVLTDTTLANAVQDNVTRLGTVTAGTLGVGVTGGSGLDLGATCRMYKTSAIASTGTGGIFFNDYTLDYNDDASIFTPVTSGTPQGIKVLIAGKYLAHHSIYTDTHSGGWGYLQHYITTGGDTQLERTYMIHVPERSISSSWNKPIMSFTLEFAVNDVIGQKMNLQVGTCYLNAGNANNTWVSLTYLGA